MHSQGVSFYTDEASNAQPEHAQRLVTAPQKNSRMHLVLRGVSLIVIAITNAKTHSTQRDKSPDLCTRNQRQQNTGSNNE